MPDVSWDSYSLLAVYSSMAVYAIAFIAFAFDVARRRDPAEVRERELVAAGGGSTTTTVAPATVAKGGRRNLAKVGFALTVLAWVLHVAGTVMRGIAAERVPWANMYEFALTSIGIIVGIFVFAQLWRDLRFLGVYITGLATVFLGVATVNFYVSPTPLPPALQSYWLVIHVFVAALGTGFFALGSGLSILQLIRSKASGLAYVDRLPGASALEDLSYRVSVMGFIFWTFTLIAGAIWAEHAWGRYWGWDTKEVWTFVIWVVYAGYIHARATRGWRGTRSAWLQLIGFAAILFNFTIVNVYFKGLHTYSGLPQ
ncbi:c-type cytochrome biogenesis protein CcsB [Agrococcus jejuensis]|uniref:Cytochrome c-type biogenesis protein CcsB n=1 Tax=Agrococcus jejuensis TaxID=399736 RepID=A0A1G8EW74_9MICO|nr:c-type cytochrome biogenesis protein CcsB [Agrococcus jejuensis]SDH74173.1 cytochrome c-type biogenesis protein CcsB [Agrococcus jejuensis]